MPARQITPHSKDHPRTDFTDKLQSFDEGVDNIMRIMEETRAMLLECNAKLDAIMEHLGVPYEPPAGFGEE